MVLARYMQISPELCERHWTIINIHHSFLPSFIGAKPYHQAYERGVKLIGEPVTMPLQNSMQVDKMAIRIDHSDSVEDLVRYGRTSKSCGSAVLALPRGKSGFGE